MESANEFESVCERDRREECARYGKSAGAFWAEMAIRALVRLFGRLEARRIKSRSTHRRRARRR